jgi:CBS domain-containing protein
MALFSPKEPNPSPPLDVMSNDLTIVAPTTTVADAATTMSTHHVGSALVLDDERLVGIFTERDVLRAVASDFDAEHHAVSEFMTKDPKTIGPEVDAHEALESMFAFGFRHLPVVDEGRVIGIVSMRDVTRRG